MAETPWLTTSLLASFQAARFPHHPLFDVPNESMSEINGHGLVDAEPNIVPVCSTAFRQISEALRQALHNQGDGIGCRDPSFISFTIWTARLTAKG